MRATAGTLLVGAAACLTAALVTHPAYAGEDSRALLKDDKLSAPDADAIQEAGQGVGYFLKALNPQHG